MAKKIIFTTLTVIWMSVIFAFSAMDSEQSTEVSMSVGGVVAETFVPGYDNWDEDKQVEFAQKIDHPIRKTAHATEYAILGFLITMTINSFFTEKKGLRFVALPLGSLYAVSDELHQTMVSGRSCQLSDVCIDTCGVFAGLMLAVLVIFIMNKLKKQTSL